MSHVFYLYQEMKTGSRVPLLNAMSENEAVALGKMLSYLNAAPVIACEGDTDGSTALSLRFMAGQLLKDGRHPARTL